MKLYIEAIAIWVLGWLGIYLILAGLGAFVGADWSYLDFTTWSKQSRFLFGLLFVGWTWLTAVVCYHKGVFEQ